MKTRVMLFTTAAVLTGAAPLAAGPAVSGDPQPAAGWTAWHGCWEPVGAGAPEGRLICVLPGQDAQSVRIATVQDGAISEETLLHADGVARPVEEGGCIGTESAFFSADGRRVFTRADLQCEGVRRVSTGVLAMVSEVEWVDVQALTVGDQSAARTLRYRAIPLAGTPTAIAAALPAERQLAQEAARLDTSAPLTVEHVVEAAGHLAAPALEALLGARQQGFDLNAERLAMLEREGVAESTIDVMVALSYPSRFAVREREYEPTNERLGLGSSPYGSECYSPMWSSIGRYSPRAYRYGGSDCYGYGGYGMGYGSYGFGYSPWGYDPYGWNYGRTPVIIVQPRDPDEEPYVRGQVVKGRGYTSGSAPARGTASPRSGGGSDASRVTRPANSTGGSVTKPATTKPATVRTATRKGGGDQQP
ncbi:MAG: hypothetical protein WEF86_06285 [Gemmatimonadota bacterium]